MANMGNAYRLLVSANKKAHIGSLTDNYKIGICLYENRIYRALMVSADMKKSLSVAPCVLYKKLACYQIARSRIFYTLDTFLGPESSVIAYYL